MSTSSCTAEAWTKRSRVADRNPQASRYSDVSGIDVAGRIPKEHLGLSSRQRLRYAGVGQLLVGVTEPITRALRGFVLLTLGWQG